MRMSSSHYGHTHAVNEESLKKRSVPGRKFSQSGATHTLKSKVNYEKFWVPEQHWMKQLLSTKLKRLSTKPSILIDQSV